MMCRETLLVTYMHCSLMFFLSVQLLTSLLAQMESKREWAHVKMGFEVVVENHSGLSHGELTFLMNSLFGGFNCAVG